MKIWRSHSVHTCPSCAALNEQCHPEEVWAAFGVEPRDERLYCSKGCRCTLEDTDAPESGDLSTVPLRHVVSLTLQAIPGAHGFQIQAIDVGPGNGYIFGPDVLKRSVPLWNGVEVFLHHDYTPGIDERKSRDVTRLAGYITEPTWNETSQAVECQLTTSGPSGPALYQLGQQKLAGAPINVGFSGDIYLRHKNRIVEEITKVNFLDCVHNPARGGAFVRALFQTDPNSGGTLMAQSTTQDPEVGVQQPPATPTPTAQGNARQSPQPQPQTDHPDVLAMRAFLQEQERASAQAAEIEAMRQTRAQMCAFLLDAGLAGSRLPEAARNHVRAQFQDAQGQVRVFDPSELQDAIEATRALVAEVQAPGLISGPGKVHTMFSTEDQLQAAVDDLVGAPREENMKLQKVHKLTGVRELYMMLTGDLDLHGGFYPSRIQLQHTTASFPGLVKNAMNKAVAEHWEALGRAGYAWWEAIVHQEDFTSLNDITWLITGTVGSLPIVAEGEEYTELQMGDNAETSSFVKRGGFVGITLETIDRDDTRKLKAAPREIANAGIRNISARVAEIFTLNSSVGPTLTDTGALFNATAVTTAGGHANLLTTALGADYTAWNAVALAMYNQPMLIANKTGYIGTGPKQAVEPRYCLVPRALKPQAEALFIPRWESQAQNVAAVSPTWGGRVEPITVPEWTDATDWAAVIDPLIVPGIGLGKRFGLLPEIFVAGDERDPAMFSNDESRIKVRHFLAVGVINWRALHKSNVAG
ncbi:MAG: hypothetical protein ACOYYS_19290 [Chloroflexota bacterium]